MEPEERIPNVEPCLCKVLGFSNLAKSIRLLFSVLNLQCPPVMSALMIFHQILLLKNLNVFVSYVPR